MKKVILSAVDPRDFMGATVYDKETHQEKPANLQDALTYLNEFLAFDGCEIVPHGKGYDVVDKTRGEIVVDVKLEPSHLSHTFIMEQIEPSPIPWTLLSIFALKSWHDRQIGALFSAVEKLLALPEPKKNPIGYIHPKD